MVKHVLFSEREYSAGRSVRTALGSLELELPEVVSGTKIYTRAVYWLHCALSGLTQLLSLGILSEHSSLVYTVPVAAFVAELSGCDRCCSYKTTNTHLLALFRKCVGLFVEHLLVLSF